MQQQLFTLIFNPNNYCLRSDRDCSVCIYGNNTQLCCPCNACPKREGYWTDSATENGKLVEVKCYAPCAFFKRWQNMNKCPIDGKACKVWDTLKEGLPNDCRYHRVIGELGMCEELHNKLIIREKKSNSH